MNKQSNVYTIVYITIVVLVVGTLLAFTSMSLRSRQQANADADKMRQILNSVHVTAQKGEKIADIFDQHIKGMMLVNANGEVVLQSDGLDAEIFATDIAAESKNADVSQRKLPVYVCSVDNGDLKYIIPVSGAGLWGPVWGYIAVDANGSTIYGAYFSHQGETPGLGAEIEKPAFQQEFVGKQLIKDSEFNPIAVVKAGQKPNSNADYVDGISGGTITSKGVGDMLQNCLQPYAAFLKGLSEKE